MIRRPPRSTQSRSSAASDVYKRQGYTSHSMKRSLYREYRPQTFAELVGQDHVARTLRNAVETDAVAHAYVFAGPRGTGKTSTCLLYTSDAADDLLCVDLGGSRIIKK